MISQNINGRYGVSRIFQGICLDVGSPASRGFQWDNYYDPDDVLGWPLSQLGEVFTEIKDHHINVGDILTSWSPALRTRYWSDRDVLGSLANILKGFLP
jgi:hypothetical protein